MTTSKKNNKGNQASRPNPSKVMTTNGTVGTVNLSTDQMNQLAQMVAQMIQVAPSLASSPDQNQESIQPSADPGIGQPTMPADASSANQSQTATPNTNELASTTVSITKVEWESLQAALSNALLELSAIRDNLNTNPPGYVIFIYDPMRPTDPILHSSLDHRYAAAILLRMFDTEYPGLGFAQASDVIMQLYVNRSQDEA